MGKKELPKRLAHQPFSYQEAVESGLTKYALNRLIEQGIIERASKGIYIPANYESTNPGAQFHLATLQCGKPSCICLLSALDYYHVTDEIPAKVWIMVPQEKRTVANNLKLIRSRNPQWNVGIRRDKDYWITTLARTLVDCLLYKNRIGSTLALETLKQALHQKKVKVGDILDMANQMNVKHRIYSYLEALAS